MGVPPSFPPFVGRGLRKGWRFAFQDFTQFRKWDMSKNTRSREGRGPYSESNPLFHKFTLLLTNCLSSRTVLIARKSWVPESDLTR